MEGEASPLWAGDLGVSKKCVLHEIFVKTAGSSSKKESKTVQNKKENHNPNNPTIK